MDRLQQVMALNPDFAEALRKGEKWAMQYADSVNGVDGKASRRHPERAHKEDGKKRNWCGSCPYKSGCMICDLDHDHEFYKKYGGRWED